MKDVVDSLNEKDKQALATFYETGAFKALDRLIELERLELAKDSLEKLDILDVRYVAGQAFSLKKLTNVLKSIHKLANKES